MFADMCISLAACIASIGIYLVTVHVYAYLSVKRFHGISAYSFLLCSHFLNIPQVRTVHAFHMVRFSWLEPLLESTITLRNGWHKIWTLDFDYGLDIALQSEHKPLDFLHWIYNTPDNEPQQSGFQARDRDHTRAASSPT